MKFNPIHSWDLTPAEAITLQKELAHRVIRTGTVKRPGLVAGCDVTSSLASPRGRAGVVVFRFPSLEPVEEQVVEGEIRFPYIPGLLSFREGPLLLRAFSRLSHEPDVIFFDGQGLAHPRRLGLASHLGIWLDRPAVGCAKSRYLGRYEEPARERGAWSPLLDAEGETIGAVLRTRTGVKPIYVSVGHRLTLAEAVRLTLAVPSGYRIPQPTRLAHNLLARIDKN